PSPINIAHCAGADATADTNAVTSPVMIRSSREAVRIGAGVAALEVDLVRTHSVELRETRRIDDEAAAGTRIELCQPSVDSIGIELVVPRAVQRVGDVDALAVAADFDHLRSAVQRLTGARGMRGPPDDAAEPHRSGLDRIEGIRHVELFQLAGAEARHIEETIVERQVDIRHEG